GLRLRLGSRLRGRGGPLVTDVLGNAVRDQVVGVDRGGGHDDLAVPEPTQPVLLSHVVLRISGQGSGGVAARKEPPHRTRGWLDQGVSRVKPAFSTSSFQPGPQKKCLVAQPNSSSGELANVISSWVGSSPESWYSPTSEIEAREKMRPK